MYGIITPRSDKSSDSRSSEVLVWKEKYNSVSDRLSQTRQKVNYYIL